MGPISHRIDYQRTMWKQLKSTLFDKLVGHQDAIIQPLTSQKDESNSIGDGILNKQT
jgi:hypothetical protein